MLHYRHEQKHFTIQMTLRMKVVHESRANECSNSWVCLRTLELLLTKQRQRLQSDGLPARQRKVKPALGIIMRNSHLICQHKRSSSPRCVPEYLAAKIRLEIKEKAELVFFFLIRAVSQIFPWGIVLTSKQQNSLCQHSCQGRGHAAIFAYHQRTSNLLIAVSTRKQERVLGEILNTHAASVLLTVIWI